MDFFAKKAFWKLLTILSKSSILDVCKGSEHASDNIPFSSSVDVAGKRILQFDWLKTILRYNLIRWILFEMRLVQETI